jgi:hypothetical protein
MAAKRYAVLDKTGAVVNAILIDDPMPKDYWPGYGAWLCYADEGVPDTTQKPALGLVTVTPDKPLQIGDTLNLKTGTVTKFVPTIKQETDSEGVAKDVASAPVQKFTDEKDAKDAPVEEPKAGVK